MNNITAKTPWKDCMGDVPMHLDYFEGSMFDKVADIARQYPDTPFLSIHLNQFPQTRYTGAQVFYGNSGQLLAASLQDCLRTILDPTNERVCKPAPEGVFLMKNIAAPAVTIECGFLSNPEECRLLQQNDYQTKIALAITGGYQRYNRG